MAFRVEANLLAKAERLAKASGLSVSDVFRAALENLPEGRQATPSQGRWGESEGRMSRGFENRKKTLRAEKKKTTSEKATKKK